MTSTGITGEWQDWSLSPESEFRFEVGVQETVNIKLKQGTAEIFGTELAKDRAYAFSACKLAIFSWDGAKLAVQGSCDVEYVSEETPMPTYLNMHMALDQSRTKAVSEGTAGPRVLVLGSGRTSVSRLLLNYAIRLGRKPIYVDLDVSKGSLLFPGVLSAQVMDRVYDLEEGFNLTAPICYFYGHSDIQENTKYYRSLITRLGSNVSAHAERESSVNSSGMIITAPPWIDDLGPEILDDVITAFSATVVIVLGNERLYSSLLKRCKKQHSGLTVLKLAKSGGVVTQHDATYRRHMYMNRIKTYFYGAKGELCPYSYVVSAKDIAIRRVGEGPVAPTSALPIGAVRKLDAARLVKVEFGNGLSHSILSMSHSQLDPGEGVDEASVATTNAAGFIFVSDVDESKGKLTLLTPCPGSLPSMYCLLGSIKWMES